MKLEALRIKAGWELHQILATYREHPKWVLAIAVAALIVGFSIWYAGRPVTFDKPQGPIYITVSGKPVQTSTAPGGPGPVVVPRSARSPRSGHPTAVETTPEGRHHGEEPEPTATRQRPGGPTTRPTGGHGGKPSPRPTPTGTAPSGGDPSHGTPQPTGTGGSPN